MRLLPALFLLLLALPARAEKFTVEADLFYFSEDDARVAALETEVVDDVLRFRFRRDPDAVARELAKDEIANGNICLRQVDADLVKVLKKKEVRKVCEKLFEREMARGFSFGSYSRDRPVCSLRVEARESKEEMSFFLLFGWERPEESGSRKRSRGLASIGRDEQPEERGREGWKEAAIGKPARGWKGLLKNGSCSLDEKVLKRFHESYVAMARERNRLAACGYHQGKRVNYLRALQKQFRVYVPEEWLKRYREREVEALLRAQPSSVFSTVKECEAESEKTAEQLEALEEIAGKIADRYGISAMEPASLRTFRGLSSEY